MSLRTLADEVSRVSLEVGSQGKLGGQAYVPDVEGVWKDLTVNVSVFSYLQRAFVDVVGESNVRVSHDASKINR